MPSTHSLMSPHHVHPLEEAQVVHHSIAHSQQLVDDDDVPLSSSSSKQEWVVIQNFQPGVLVQDQHRESESLCLWFDC